MTPSFLPADWRERIEKSRQQPKPRWMRVLAWIWIGSTALGLIGALAVVVLLNNARFHSYVIQQVELQASESLGTGVHLQYFALNFHALSVDLYGVTID